MTVARPAESYTGFIPDLSPGTLAVVLPVLADFTLFCRCFIKVRRKWGKKVLVPLELTPAQQQVAAALILYDRIIVPKARQLGVSTVLRAWHVYRAWCAKGAEIYGCLSHHDRSAKSMHRMATQMLAELPSVLQRKLSVSNATEHTFADTSASVQAFTAGSKYGTRSFAFTDAHLSECAFYADLGDTLATVLATVGDGQVVLESTAWVPDDHFHKLIQGAPGNGWFVVFLPWYLEAGYRKTPPADFVRTPEEQELADRYGLVDAQLYWRRQEIGSLGFDRFRREYPITVDECFLRTAGTWLPPALTDWIEGIPLPEDGVLVAPDRNDTYVFGVDVGGGGGGDSDDSVIFGLSLRTREPVFVWRSNTISPAQLGDKAVQIASRYNNGLILVESNSIGLVTSNRINDLCYRHVWLKDGKPWVTSGQTKLMAFEALRDMLTARMWPQLPGPVLSQIRALQSGTLAPSAPAKQHDDLAMAAALAVIALRGSPGYTSSTPPLRDSHAPAFRRKHKPAYTPSY